VEAVMVTEHEDHEVRIRPTNEDLVKAYASICFDHCFLVHNIKVIKGRGSFYLTSQQEAERWHAFPANVENAADDRASILAEYEKIVAGADRLNKRGRI
jgi:stage V sporulation protein G